MVDNSPDIHPDVVQFLENGLNDNATQGVVLERTGDSLTRDGILEALATAPRQDDETRAIEHYMALLRQQPPFRLERDDDNVHLVMMLGNRRVHTWTLTRPNEIDAEVIALLGKSLKNLARRGTETESAGGPTDALEPDMPKLAGPGEATLPERARQAVEEQRRSRRALNALKEWIGAGKTRDDLLEMALPDLPEHAQTVLAEKLNEQPPFRMECDRDGSVHLVLIVSGERVHTWTPEDLGVPRPWSWRIIAYPVAGLFVVVCAMIDKKDWQSWGEALITFAWPVVVFAMLDGFFFLRRTRGSKMAGRAYWAEVGLLIFFSAALESVELLVLALAMGIARVGYLYIWVRFFIARDILECPNCGALVTHGVWVEQMSNYRCAGCGTMAEPITTGRRASLWGGVD